MEEADQKQELVLPTVEVTADKRTTEAQKTPLTMDVITAQDIVDADHLDHDVFTRMPNMVASTQYIGGMNFMTYRGRIPRPERKRTRRHLRRRRAHGNVPDPGCQPGHVERIEILAAPASSTARTLLPASSHHNQEARNEMEGKVHTQVDSRGSYEAGATVSGRSAWTGCPFR